MSESEKLSAFEQGYRAHHYGIHRHAYTQNKSAEWIEQWLDGWDTAEYEESEGNGYSDSRR